MDLKNVSCSYALVHASQWKDTGFQYCGADSDQPFTITHYSTIMSTWQCCVPLPRFKYLYTCRILGGFVAVECIKMWF